MSGRAEAVRDEALALSESDRAGLVIDLLDSLDDRPVEGDQAELARIWAAETARRADQIDSADVATDSWDDVLAQVEDSRRGR